MVEGEEWWGALPQLKSRLPACLLYALGLRILYFFIQKEGARTQNSGVRMGLLEHSRTTQYDVDKDP